MSSTKKEDGDTGRSNASREADMEIQAEKGVEEEKVAAGDEEKEGAKEGEKEEGLKDEGGKPKREPEPTSFKIKNPARVTPTQEPFVHFDLEQRYVSTFLPLFSAAYVRCSSSKFTHVLPGTQYTCICSNACYYSGSTILCVVDMMQGRVDVRTRSK